MNEKQRRECEKLRALTSAEAATYLIETYPAEGPAPLEAIALIPHRSWKRNDQLRLARHYLRRLPFANARPYEAFASFMSLPLLVSVLEEFVPGDAGKRDLFFYYAARVLNQRAQTAKDRTLVQSFLVRVARH